MDSFSVDPTPPDQGSLIIYSRPVGTSSDPAPPARIKRRSDWVDIDDIIDILWPGMAMAELMETIEAVYGFKATSEMYSLFDLERV